MAATTPILMGMNGPESKFLSGADRAEGTVLMPRGIAAPVLFLAILALFCANLSAQSGRGRITGEVTDTSGAMIPAVEVTVVNPANQTEYKASTNEAGLYSVVNLPTGAYTVTFKRDGFKTVERSGITVGVSQVVNLTVQLPVGGVAESITVSEDVGLLQTENAEVGTTMKSAIATDLPLNVTGARSIESFAYAITPSVEGNSWSSRIAGGADFTKEVIIDGTSQVSQIGGYIGESSPSMEAVAEFKVQTSGISAEYGRTGGGVFNFALKSGSNQFHGSAFAYLRNEVFNANTWQNNALAAMNPDKADDYKRAKDRQHLWGLSLGGPVLKNKTFFFAAWEPYNQNRFVLGGLNSTTPTTPFLNGDFSAILRKDLAPLGKDKAGNDIYPGQILDPKTGLVFANNIIPQSRISSVSRKITDIYRKSYAPMAPDRIVNNMALPAYVDPKFEQKQLTYKIDHNFSDKNRISGSHIWTHRPRTLVDAGGIWDTTDPTGGPLAKSRLHEVTTHALRASDTHVFSPAVLNVLSVGYNRFRNPSTAWSASSGNWPDTLGFGDIGGTNFPEIDFGGAVNGISTTGIGYNSNDFYVTNVYLLNNSLSWVKGRHNMKFGFEGRHMQMNSHSGPPRLDFNFTNNSTGVPAVPWSNQVGLGFASFLLGEVESAEMTVPIDLYGRRNYFAFYAQDDFKASSRLTLNFGLRWEFTTPYHEKYGRWTNLGMHALNPKTGTAGALEFADSGSTSFEKNRDWFEFGPRAGFAYQASNRLVARGGYGVFFSPIGLNYWSGVPYGFAPGYRGVNQVRPNGDLSPAFNWDGGYPGKFAPALKDPSYMPWGVVNTDENSLKAGYIHQYNAGVEYEITSNLVVGVNYMGNIGRRLQSGDLRRNQPFQPVYSNMLKAGKEWNWVSDEASAADAGVKYPYAGFSNFAFMAATPYPQVAETWGPIFFVGSPLGKSQYNALQLTLSKRLSKGLAAEMSYTLSKSTTNVDSGWQERWWTGNIQDVTKLDEEARVVAPFDRRHVYKGYVSYDLPFGKGKKFASNANGFVNALIGGWTLSTVFRYESGAPLQVLSANWYPGWNMSGASSYANITDVADFSNYFDRSKYNAASQADPNNRFFNPKTFANPERGDFGNAPRFLNQLRGFGAAYEDLGILKNFTIMEKFRFQIRAEFLNIFNRHYFDNPTTDMNSPYFGQVVSSTGTPRQGQLGARFEF